MAALPGRFVSTADDQPFSARHHPGSITNSYPGRRRSRNTRYNLGAWPGEKRSEKKPSGGKTHFGRRPVGKREVSSLKSRVILWKLVTLLISELYTGIYHINVYIIYVDRYM